MPRNSSSEKGSAYSLPISYIFHLLEISARWGVPAQALLNDSGISARQLEQREGRVSTRQVGLVAKRLMELSGRQDIGLAFGNMIRPTSHGFLGYAAMSCATFGEATTVVLNYLQMQLNDFVFRPIVGEQEVIVNLEEAYSFGSMRQVFFESMLVAICQHSAFIVGRDLSGWVVSVDWSEPAYFESYSAHLPQWKFDQPRIQIGLPRSFLSLPLMMADPHAVQHAIAQMEKEAQARALRDAPDIVPRVREALRSASPGYPDLQAVADRLLISKRTLVRRLAEAGTTFQSLLDDERHRHALELIQQGSLAMHQIALQLGYTDPAAFTRAFKRWTGRRPSDLR